MSYPRKSISLQKANNLITELENLVLEDAEFLCGDDFIEMKKILVVLRKFGVTARTSVKTSDYSPFSTSVLQYVKVNLGYSTDCMEELLSDWYACYEVRGLDKIEFANHNARYQGC